MGALVFIGKHQGDGGLRVADVARGAGALHLAGLHLPGCAPSVERVRFSGHPRVAGRHSCGTTRICRTRANPLQSCPAGDPANCHKIARRLGRPTFTKDLIISKDHLDNFVEHPVELLCEIIRNLDADSRAALALVFMRGGALTSPIMLEKDEEGAVALMGGSRAGVREAFGALDGGLVLQSIDGGSYYWRFKHPTIRDAFAESRRRGQGT